MEQRARKLLDQAGLKKTPGRIAVLNCLLSEAQPLTQQDISDMLSDFQINEVSIYRSLEAFLRAGIVHRIEGVDQVWRFAISQGEPLGGAGACHPHFVCTQCGKVECLTELEIPDITPGNSNYIVKSKEMVLKGSCEECVN